MKKYYYILLLAVISMTSVSCDEWVFYDTPPAVCSASIVGSWESDYEYDGYAAYNIRGYDVVSLDFYKDHTGCYYFYSDWGLSYIDFEWNICGNRIQLWYEDDYYEELYYGYKDNGFLMLSQSPYFDYYIVYRSVSVYYEQGKSNNRAKAKPFNPSTDENPRPVLMKAKEF